MLELIASLNTKVYSYLTNKQDVTYIKAMLGIQSKLSERELLEEINYNNDVYILRQGREVLVRRNVDKLA